MNSASDGSPSTLLSPRRPSPLRPANAFSRSPSIVASSEAGEREEAMAYELKGAYWDRIHVFDASPRHENVLVKQEEPAEMDEEDQAMSPSLPPSPSLRPQLSSLPPSSPPPTVSTRPSPFLPSPTTLPSPRLDPPNNPIASTSRLATSPPPPSSPSSTPIVVEQPHSSPASRSPSRSPSPPPPQPSFEIPPDPEPFGARSFRKRTVAQLNPFSIEQAKYTASLLRNGWQGAVVAGPKAVEQSAEMLKRKKELMEMRGKDDLGGWLEFEEGQRVADEEATQGLEPVGEESEESVDGMVLLRREEKRLKKMERQVAKALCGSKGKGKQREGDGTGSRHYRQSSRIDTSDDNDDEPRQPKRVPSKATKRPRDPYAAKRSRKGHSSDGDQRPNKSKRPINTRAESEPPTSSPDKNSARITVVKKRPRTALPSKSVHGRQKSDGRTTALDRQILDIAVSSSDEERDVRLGSGSEMSVDDEEEEEEDSDIEMEAPVVTTNRTKLGGKRKKALGMMMPAVFMKKAQADLKLMEREKREGAFSGSDLGSGDDDLVLSDGSDGKARKRGKIRRDPNRLDQPFRLDDEAFTDESGEDENAQDPSEEEEEHDAVASWLHSFAPQRQKASNEDIVDRFLKQARHKKSRTTTTKKRRRTEGKRAEDGARAGVGSKEGTTRRPPLHEDGTGRVINRSTASNASNAPRPKQARPAVKVISLDTDRGLFDLAGFHNAPEDDDDVVIIDRAPLAPRQAIAPAAPVARGLPPITTIRAPPPLIDEDDEQWASFGKFSHDFGILRLPAGIQFVTNSFVQVGHLFSLLNPSSTTRPYRACEPFGIGLRSTASLDEIEAQVPLLCDSIFDSLSLTVEEGAEAIPADAVEEAMRFLGSYMSETVVDAGSDSTTRFAAGVSAQLDRLDLRLDTIRERDRASTKVFNKRRISFSWLLVDFATRVSIIKPSANDKERVQRLATALVKRLVAHGVEHTTKALKNFMVDSSTTALIVSDASVDAWLGLVSLATKEGLNVFQEEDLWRIVGQEASSAVSKTAKSGPIVGEVTSYIAMTLCAISQFTSSGMSTSTPRLIAHWPTVMRMLDPIQPSALSKSDHSLSNTAVARRDRYLWTLVARCLVFVERWGWSIIGNEELLHKLFDLLNARRLADLTIETNGDFPQFLQDLSLLDSIQLDLSDTAFVLFLKLVVHSAQQLSSKPEKERSRRLTRLFLRLSPMASAPWTRQSLEITRSGSILVNHYSLFMTFALLSPSSAPQRLDQARRLLLFSDADQLSRQCSIRALLYFTFIFRRLSLNLDPIAEWISSVANQLRGEYVEMEKQRRKEDKGTRRTVRKGQEDPLWRCAVICTMVLRAVQHALNQGEEKSFPTLTLLQPAWTSHFLDSPLALDPMIGLEVVRCINCFLDLRRMALPRRSATREEPESNNTGVSQDEFGMFDLDIDDPELNRLLGVQTGEEEPVEKEVEVVKKEDKKLAEFIKTNLSPAFFRLVSNILVATGLGRGGPTIGDRSAYAQRVVECWTRCLSVMIENDVVEWSPYLRYGDHSWKRISDPLGRRDIGMLLAIHILKHDIDVFSLYQDEFLEIWFQSAVSRKLSAQHQLMSALLNVDKVSPLFFDHPFGRDDATGSFNISDETFDDYHVATIARVFKQISKLLSPTELFQAQQPIPKPTLLNLLRGMLAAMRDNLASISDEQSRSRYAKFCREVLEALKACGASDQLHEQMTTIPARLARLTTTSGSWPVAHARARSLYRQWYRAAPEITQLYAINIPASAIRAKVRQEFERNQLVDDLETLDILLLKGHQEYQETVNCWKMESQLMNWFSKEELPARPETFLDAFYLSRDDPKSVQPTA